MKALLTISIVLALAISAFGQDYADNPIQLRIAKKHDFDNFGKLVAVPVTISGYQYELGGFDLLIKYVPDFISLQSIEMGESLVSCGWEYFTFRVSPNLICNGAACPPGLVRIVSIAETNNGPQTPGCYAFDDKTVLFTMHFLVTSDRTKECQYSPVRFIWYDCTDDMIMLKDRDTILVSQYVFDYEAGVEDPINVNNSMDDPYYDETPSYFGTKETCIDNPPLNAELHRGIWFINGGVDNVCAGLPNPTGDVNLNGFAYEIADAVLLLDYLVRGERALTINMQGQKAAADVNLDGSDYSIADFVQIIRVISGNAWPPPQQGIADTDRAGYRLDHGMLSLERDVAGLIVIAQGEVNPILLADQMEMRYEYDSDDDVTRIVVYSFESNTLMSGPILDNINGEVSFVEASTELGESIILSKLVPASFVLFQNYPNPFNPLTRIEFAMGKVADYTLTITNGLGQVVEEIHGRPASAGVVRIEWDGSAYASGVYIYRVVIDGVDKSKKMVLLK